MFQPLLPAGNLVSRGTLLSCKQDLSHELLSYHMDSPQINIYNSFQPDIAFISTCTEDSVSTDCHIQCPHGCAVHMIVKMKTIIAPEYQFGTAQFCIVAWLSRAGCFYVHVISCKGKQMKTLRTSTEKLYQTLIKLLNPFCDS